MSGELTSFSDSAGQHVAYEDANFHIHQLYYNGSWVDQDLTRVTGSQVADNSTPLSSFSGGSQDEHIVFEYLYSSNVLHVEQYYYNGGWHAQDLTAAVGAPPVYSALTTFDDSQGQHVVYEDKNSYPNLHIHQLYYNGGWSDQDLTVESADPDRPATSSPLTSFAEHVAYISGNGGHVWQIYYTSNWASQDLTAAAGTSFTAAAGSPLTSFSDSNGQHVLYVDGDSHIHHLYYNNGVWVDQDLTAIT